MGTVLGRRTISVLALALLVTFAAPRPGPAPSTASSPPIEALEGQGGWGWRFLCVGCVAAVAWGGISNPLLMINFYTRAPSFVQGCSLACLSAL